MSRPTVGRHPTHCRSSQVDYVAIFPISLTSMAYQIFSWLCVLTCGQFITTGEALSLKSTLLETNYQVMLSTEKLKFCELELSSAVCFECSNRNYCLFLPSLLLFISLASSLSQNHQKVPFYQKPMSLSSQSFDTPSPGMFSCLTLFTLHFFYGKATHCMR